MRMNRVAQRGAQAVEFALVLPLMILVIFAVLDFGFLVYNKAIITNAAREGARFGSSLSTSWSTSEIRQVACTIARTSVVNVGGEPIADACDDEAGTMIVSVLPSTQPAFNEPVTVTVSFASRGFSQGNRWNLGVGPDSIGAPVTISATTLMSPE